MIGKILFIATIITMLYIGWYVTSRMQEELEKCIAEYGDDCKLYNIVNGTVIG